VEIYDLCIMIPILAQSVENLTDARYFAARQVDWISLTAEAAGREVLDLDRVREIASWLDGTQLVLSFDETPVAEALWLTRESGISAVSMPYRELSEDPGLDLFMRVSYGTPGWSGQLSRVFRNGCFAVLQDLPADLPVEELKALLPTPFLRKKCFLDTAVDADKLALVDKELPGVGFCVNGSSEEKLGVKSFDELDLDMDLLRPWD